MTKKKRQNIKEPFKAKTMGNYQRELRGVLSKKESQIAMSQASPVTIFRPDEEGNVVAVDTVVPIFTKTTEASRRQRVHQGAKSLL